MIIEWNKLDPYLRKAESLSVFKTNILKFIRPPPNSVYNCHDPKGFEFLIRFNLGLSYLREHKLKHNFQGTINPLCSYGYITEFIHSFNSLTTYFTYNLKHFKLDIQKHC